MIRQLAAPIVSRLHGPGGACRVAVAACDRSVHPTESGLGLNGLGMHPSSRPPRRVKRTVSSPSARRSTLSICAPQDDRSPGITCISPLRGTLSSSTTPPIDVPRTPIRRCYASGSPTSTGGGDEKPKALLPPEVAAELMFEVGWESLHRYLDVRTPDEYSRGRPKGAVNVPYMLKSSTAEAGKALNIKPGGLRMRENPDFLQQVLAYFPPDSRLIVGSENKSRRAMMAVALLEQNGFTHVLAMEGGKRAWAKEELPMESDGDDAAAPTVS